MYIQEEWLQEIKNDIEKKYSITEPRFFIENAEVSHYYTITRWIEKQLTGFDRAVQYKRLNDAKFELSAHHLIPPFTVCESIIDTYLKKLPVTNLERRFTLSYIKKSSEEEASQKKKQQDEEVVGATEYTEEEVRQELLYLARFGQSDFSSYKDPTIREDAIVYHIWARPQSLPKMLKAGYLELEHKKILSDF